jgi:hypothetical protein
MRNCGEAAAAFTFKTRTVHVCYEMIDEFNEQERDVKTARRGTGTAGHAVARGMHRQPPAPIARRAKCAAMMRWNGTGQPRVPGTRWPKESASGRQQMRT